jgi:hypothetical protein
VKPECPLPASEDMVNCCAQAAVQHRIVTETLIRKCLTTMCRCNPLAKE